MGGLRLTLLIVGALIIAGIWWWSRRDAGTPSANGGRTEPSLGADADERDPTTPGMARQRHADPEEVTQMPSRVWEPGDGVDFDFGSEPGAAEAAAGDRAAHEAPAFDPAHQMLLTLMVLPASGERFLGADVLAVLEEMGLRFGARRIFHRLDASDGSVWSVAHMLEPGHLDPATLQTDWVHGLVLFAVIPGAKPGTDAFADMLATARRIAQRLRGELADGDRSSLTPQTIQHLREKVLEFERRHAGAGD